MSVLVGFLSLEARGITNASENKTALNHIKIHFTKNEVIWLLERKVFIILFWLMNNP